MAPGLPLDIPYRIEAGRRLKGRAVTVLRADGDGFVSREVPELVLDLEGIVGDFHRGHSRRSGGREPWYRRGTVIRNERQVSIVSPDELSEVARRMELAELRPGWIGANIAIADIADLSMLPSGTLLFFEGGATLKIDSQNHPCKMAGRAIADHVGAADREAMALLFPKVAQQLRGVVAWVEKPGTIRQGEAVSVRVPRQWIYRG